MLQVYFIQLFLYPTRKDLAVIFKRLLDANYPFTGFADHGVSEALYLNDPDENGVELYWDKPRNNGRLMKMAILICTQKNWNLILC